MKGTGHDRQAQQMIMEVMLCRWLGFTLKEIKRMPNDERRRFEMLIQMIKVHKPELVSIL